ncbi:MAG: restriction endonuclease [Bacilli bacterium]
MSVYVVVITVGLVTRWITAHEDITIIAGILAAGVAAGYGYVKIRRVRLDKQQAENARLAIEQRLRDSGITQIDVMTGRQFEERMALYFRDHGHRVETTPVSGDYGADLVLFHQDGSKTVVQVKRYSASVGVDAVQAVIGATRYYNAQHAMIVTNSHLTKNAKELAQISNVQVWEREDLINHLADQVASPITKDKRIN